MTTPTERTQAILQTRELLEALAVQPSASPEALEDLREQAAALLQHYPDATHLESASWNCSNIFGKPLRPAAEAELEEKPRTLSGWVSWLFFQDSERGQTVVASIGAVGGVVLFIAALWLNVFTS